MVFSSSDVGPCGLMYPRDGAGPEFSTSSPTFSARMLCAAELPAEGDGCRCGTERPAAVDNAAVGVLIGEPGHDRLLVDTGFGVVADAGPCHMTWLAWVPCAWSRRERRAKARNESCASPGSLGPARLMMATWSRVVASLMRPVR